MCNICAVKFLGGGISDELHKRIVHAFDLNALKENWEDHNGILIPKEGSRADIRRFTRGEDGLIPYASVTVLAKEEEYFMETARIGFEVHYRNGGMKAKAIIHPNTLFHAVGDGIDEIVLSHGLSLKFQRIAQGIVNCYKSMPKLE